MRRCILRCGVRKPLLLVEMARGNDGARAFISYQKPLRVPPSYRAAVPSYYAFQRLCLPPFQHVYPATIRPDFQRGPFAVASHDLRLDQTVADNLALRLGAFTRLPIGLDPPDNISHREISAATYPPRHPQSVDDGRLSVNSVESNFAAARGAPTKCRKRGVSGGPLDYELQRG